MSKKSKKESYYDTTMSKIMKDASVIENHLYNQFLDNQAKIVFKTGLVGKINEDILVYCNEKDEVRGGFLFKCCKGCKHDPIQ